MRFGYQANPNNDFYVRSSAYQTPSKFAAAIQLSHIVSANALHELRTGFLRRIFDRPPVSGTLGPTVAISGVATLDSNTSAGQRYEEDQYNAIDDFSCSVGPHQLRLCTDIDTMNVPSQDRLPYQYSFASLALYLNTIHGVINPATQKPYNYTSFTEAFGDNVASHRTTPINFYLQDHWRVNGTFNFDYGLRWEYRVFPDLNQNAPLAISRILPSDYRNFAPRLGFTYWPFPNTVLRGGFGINYDTLNLRLISLVDPSNGQQVQTYTVNGTAAGAHPREPPSTS